MSVCYTKLANDSNPSNDTVETFLFVSPEFTTPYEQDFEQAAAFMTVPGSAWNYVTPDTGVFLSAHSGGKAWVTQPARSCSNPARTYLYSPLFQYLWYLASDTFQLGFYHYCAMGDPGDYAMVQYSRDGGCTWKRLGYAGSPLGVNWYNKSTRTFDGFQYQDSGWMYSAYRFPASLIGASSNLIFRFVFHSNASGFSAGWAIDDLSLVLNDEPNDVGFSRITDPVSNYPNNPLCIYTAATGFLIYQIGATLVNHGQTGMTSVRYNCRLGKGPNSKLHSFLWVGYLMPGDSTSITTPALGKINLGLDTMYIETSKSNDVEPSNNRALNPYQGVACSKKSNSTDMAEKSSPGMLQITPNPASDAFTIRYQVHDGGAGFYYLADLSGRKILSGQLIGAPGENRAEVDVSSLTPGIYLVQLIFGEEKWSAKVVIHP